MAAADPEFAAIAEAVRREQRPLAISLAGRAHARGHRHPLVLLLTAEGLEERGQGDKALDLLKAATRAAPKHRVAWMRLAALLARRRNFEAAAEAFDAALGLDPNAFPALMGAAEMRMMLNDLPLAETHYRRASEVAPDAAAPLAVLAVMAAQEGRSAAARDLAKRAAALEPGILGAEMATARADLLEGAPDLAEARLTRLLARPGLDPDNQAGALDVRAAARDAQDRPSEAFADYAARNAIMLRLSAPRIDAEPYERRSELARRLTAFMTESPIEAWGPSAGPDTLGGRTVRGHVFLVGFPRSGTTLLEKALAGHPAVASLEEVGHLDAASRLLIDPKTPLSRLTELTSGEADILRQVYWRGVGKTLGEGLTGKILIDKMPLHTLALPVIVKLFPDARILFALRDPRDVVLSCFRRRFRINAAMFEFLTLEGAARFYDATMTLAAACRAKLPLALREVRHESLIADFDREMGEILAFIGADWDPEVRNFAGRVAGRMRTPSYSQLSRGLNSEGVGQWRRYEAHMAPVLGILEPWVGRYGYEATPALAAVQ